MAAESREVRAGDSVDSLEVGEVAGGLKFAEAHEEEFHR
jgi:hypothetical protein